MASCGPETCGYCGVAPCVGDDCPSSWYDDGSVPVNCGVCGELVAIVYPDGRCRRCHCRDAVTGEEDYWEE